jgi:hypothetical protein
MNAEGTPVGPDLSAPHQPDKGPSTSVGARVVECSGEGLYGRSLGDCVVRVGLLPVSVASPYLGLMRITADDEF